MPEVKARKDQKTNHFEEKASRSSPRMPASLLPVPASRRTHVHVGHTPEDPRTAGACAGGHLPCSAEQWALTFMHTVIINIEKRKDMSTTAPERTVKSAMRLTTTHSVPTENWEDSITGATQRLHVCVCVMRVTDCRPPTAPLTRETKKARQRKKRKTTVKRFSHGYSSWPCVRDIVGVRERATGGRTRQRVCSEV